MANLFYKKKSATTPSVMSGQVSAAERRWTAGEGVFDDGVGAGVGSMGEVDETAPGGEVASAGGEVGG